MRATFWLLITLVLPGGLAAQADSALQTDSGLQDMAGRAAAAMTAQNPSDLAGGTRQLVIQLPGVKPSGPVDRPQALALLKGFFQGAEEAGTTVTGSRTVSAERGVVELLRRYRTRGTQTVREQMILLGYRWDGEHWQLVEVRIE